jgi:hypothetical protein
MRLNNIAKPKSLLGASAGIILLSVATLSPVTAQNSDAPATVAQILRGYGLERESQYFHFDSKQITADKAVFRGVHFGSDLSASVFTIERETGGPRIAYKFENANFSTDDSILKFDSGIFIDNNLRGPTGATTADNFIKLLDENLNGDASFTRLELGGKDDQPPILFATLALNNIRDLGNDKWRFEDIDATGISGKAENFEFRIASININDLNEAAFKLFEDKGGLANFGKASLGLFKIEGFTLSDKRVSVQRRNGNNNSFGGFSLGNFEIRGLNGNNLSRFAIENVAASAVISDEDLRFKLAEFSFNDLDTHLLRAVFAYMMSDTSDPELEAYMNLPLNRVYASGPLSSGVSAFRFGGLELSGSGVEVKLDDLSFNQTKGANGLITAINVPPGKLDVNITDARKTFGTIVKGGLDAIGLSSVNISWKMRSSFNQETDKVLLEEAEIKMSDFMSLDGTARVDNLWASMAQTTFRGLMSADPTIESLRRTSPFKAKAKNATKATESDPETPSTPATASRQPSAATAMDEIARALATFPQGKMVNMQINLRDLGALAKIATQEAASKGKRPAEVRQSWRAPFATAMADKSKPVLARLIGNGFGNWLLNGGTLHIEFAPASPFLLPRLVANNATAPELGLKVENRQ